MFVAELTAFDFFFLITVLCHVLSCLCVSVGHNPTQDVTMATAAVLDEPSNMECTVCHEHFTLPKLLPCGHLLCRHCLVSWLKSQREASCPLCRCAIVDPKELKGRSLEDVADGFPTDLAMAALVEADRLLSKQHVCCVCVNVAAVSLCLTCGDMFCQSCSTVHKKQSLSKHHKLGNLTSLTVQKLAANRPATCGVHDDKMSEVYCPTHGASICLLCATTTHRQCPEVTNLETRMEQARAELAKLVAMLSAGETELEQAISQLDQQLQDLDKRTQTAVAEIEATADRLESAVKAWCRRLKELALRKCADAKTPVLDGKTLLLQRRGRLTSHKHVTQRVQGFSAHGSFGDMAAMMKTRVHDLDCSAKLPKGAKVISTLTLTIDPQAVSRIEQELSQLGQLHLTPVLQEVPRCRSLSSVETPAIETVSVSSTCSNSMPWCSLLFASR